MLRLALLAVLLTTSVFATAGCGKSSNGGGAVGSQAGGSSSSPTTTQTHQTPLSQAQWLARSQAICGALVGELRKLQVRSTNELPRVLPREAIYLRSAVAELTKLVPPPSKAPDWQELLKAGLRWAEGTVRLANDPNVGRLLESDPLVKDVMTTHNRVIAVAKRNGLSQCAAA